MDSLNRPVFGKRKGPEVPVTQEAVPHESIEELLGRLNDKELTSILQELEPLISFHQQDGVADDRERINALLMEANERLVQLGEKRKIGYGDFS